LALALVVGFTFAGRPRPAPARDRAGKEDEPALRLIMDASGSMNASDGGAAPKSRRLRARSTASSNALPEDSLVGLRVYGHRIPNTDKARGCKDTELIAPVGPSAAP